MAQKRLNLSKRAFAFENSFLAVFAAYYDNTSTFSEVISPIYLKRISWFDSLLMEVECGKSAKHGPNGSAQFCCAKESVLPSNLLDYTRMEVWRNGELVRISIFEDGNNRFKRCRVQFHPNRSFNRFDMDYFRTCRVTQLYPNFKTE